MLLSLRKNVLTSLFKEVRVFKVLGSVVFENGPNTVSESIKRFPRVTSIGSQPPKTLGKSRGPPQNPAETPQNPRRDPAEPSERPPAEPSERQISSESLAEGCAPRMVTLRNFKRVRFQTPNSASFLGLTEFRGANSVSSSQPIICVPKRTHRAFRRTHRVCPKLPVPVLKGKNVAKI